MTHRFPRRYWVTFNHLIYRRRAFSQLYGRRRERHAASGIKSRIYFFLRLILIPRNRLKIASPMLTKPRAHRIASTCHSFKLLSTAGVRDSNWMPSFSSLGTCTAYNAEKAAEKIAENPESVHAARKSLTDSIVNLSAIVVILSDDYRRRLA